jgi:hypothetical protein
MPYQIYGSMKMGIEWENKEFQRRTRPMEIVAGETVCYRILAFIAIEGGLSSV